MRTVPHAGRIFLSLWMVFVFYADPLLEISTVRYLYLPRAVVEGGTFAVDAYAHASRGDLATHGGHYFSGSPPGLGLALSPLALARSWLDPYSPLPPNQALQIMALVFFQAPLAALAVLLLWALLLDLGYTAMRSGATALSLGLATPFFFFTSKLSDYPLAAFLMVVIARISWGWRRSAASTRHAVLAGLVLGLAWTLNDLAALLTTSMLVAGSGRAPARTWARRIALAILGALPGILARAFYMSACFGSPFANPLHFSAAGITVTEEYAALGGLAGSALAMAKQFPLLAWDLTAGRVGLFTFAPVTLLLFGWLRKREQNDAVASGATAPAPGTRTPGDASPAAAAEPSRADDRYNLARAGLVVFGLNAALHLFLLNGLWVGGASWGPRYLLFSAVPLALAGAWAAGAWSRRTCRTLAALSAFITWVGVQYGYSTSIPGALGHLFLGGPTTPAFRWLWLRWPFGPTPERAAWVWEETPRIGAYYALTHPSPFTAYLLLALLLYLLWRPIRLPLR